jgi:hypothetical protein
LSHAIALIPDLLTARKYTFSFAQIDDNLSRLYSLHNATDDITFTVGIFSKDKLTLGLSKTL